MKQRALILLSLVAGMVNAQNKCNLWQVCKNHEDITPGTAPTDSCTDGSAVGYPQFVEGGYDPAPMDKDLGGPDMFTACPFFELENPGGNLCCNSDTATIMKTNFAQLDGVFAIDSPICAANLKRMWCEYACSPTKGDFLADFGTALPPKTEPQTFNYTNVQVSIDDAYACTIFTSCKQTSFISAAGVSSAVGFLNFLGTNGATYSLSWINFTETNTNTTSYLNSTVQACQDKVNDTLWGYPNMRNSTCSFCARACPPPVVSDEIAFLDGFSWKIVGWSYLSFILFTILFQVVTHCWLKKKTLERARNQAQANQTGSTAVGTSGQDSMQRGRVNLTHNTSDQGSRRPTNMGSQNSYDD